MNAAIQKFADFAPHLQRLCQAIGASILSMFGSLGRLSFFIGDVVRNCVTPPFFFRHLLRQFMDIGYYSLPVVGMTALFTGMVLALQSYTGFRALMPKVPLHPLLFYPSPVNWHLSWRV